VGLFLFVLETAKSLTRSVFERINICCEQRRFFVKIHFAGGDMASKIFFVLSSRTDVVIVVDELKCKMMKEGISFIIPEQIDAEAIGKIKAVLGGKDIPGEILYVRGDEEEWIYCIETLLVPPRKSRLEVIGDLDDMIAKILEKKPVHEEHC